MNVIRWKASLIGLLIFAVFAIGCGPDDIDQFDNPASITAVGPVNFDGTSVLIDYALRDQEGDDQTVVIRICEKSETSKDRCPTPVQGAGGDGLVLLPTVPKGTDVPHRFSWNVGCGRVESGACLETKAETEYVARVKIEGDDTVAVSDPFSLKETFSTDDVPACDVSAGTIPEVCDPNANGNSQ